LLRLQLSNKSLQSCNTLKKSLCLLILIFSVIPLSFFRDNEESGRDETCNCEAYNREYYYAADGREYRFAADAGKCQSERNLPEQTIIPENQGFINREAVLPDDRRRTNILDITDGDIRLISGNITIDLTQYGTDGEEKFSDKMMVCYSSENNQKNPGYPRLTLDGSGIDLSDYNYYISIFSNCRQLEDYTSDYGSKKTFQLDGCLDYNSEVKIQPDSYPVKPSEDQLGLSDLIIRKGEAVTFRINAVPDNNFRVPKDISIKVRLYINSGEEHIDSEPQYLSDGYPEDFVLTYRPENYKEIYCIIPVVYAEKINS